MTEQSLFIKIGEDGKPQTHPILEQNLIDTIKDFDPSNPPAGFVKFIKTPIPQLHPYERYDYLDYVYSAELSEKYGQETWQEVHNIIKLDIYDREEIIAKYKHLNPKMSDWVYDEGIMSLVPPVSKPDDGKEYYWNVDVKAWQESKPNLQLEEILEFAKQIGLELNTENNENITEETIRKIVDMINLGK
jgi:hypothetical protein